MKYLLLDVRPKFLERVAAQPAEEAKPDANRRVAGCVVAWGAPSVREKLLPGMAMKRA